MKPKVIVRVATARGPFYPDRIYGFVTSATKPKGLTLSYAFVIGVEREAEELRGLREAVHLDTPAGR